MIAKITKTVFIADDSELFITSLSHILASAGHRACHAPGGREAIDRLKKGLEGSDLLVVDLEMPGIDGFGVLEWLKENGCGGRLPALAITGAGEVSSVIARVRGLGAAGIITKDFTPEEFVWKYLARRMVRQISRL